MVRMFGREWGTKTESLGPLKAESGGQSQGSGEKARLEYRADVDVNDAGYVVYKPRNIMDYYDKYFDRDLVRGPIDDLAESAFGLGYYTTVNERAATATLEEGRTTGSKKAKKVVDDFGKENNLDDWLVNVGKNLLIAGFLPVDTRLIAGPVEKNTIKLIHPTTVKEVWVDKFGEISRVVQSVKGGEDIAIDGRYIAWFNYGQVGNDPFGVSWIRGMVALLDMLDSATDNVNLILERYLSPKVIYKILKGRDFDATKAAILNTPAGEDLFLGDLSPEEMAKGSLYDIISIDPRVPFWDFIIYLDRRMYSYGRGNNLWYSKDANVASAEELNKIVRRHENSLQRAVKRGVERYWFTPLTQLNVGRDAEVPRLNFGVEKTGVEDIHIEPLLVKGLDVRYITPEQYYDLLLQLGLKVKPGKPIDVRPPQTDPAKKVGDEVSQLPTKDVEAPKTTEQPQPKGEEGVHMEDGNTWIVRRLRADVADHKHS